MRIQIRMKMSADPCGSGTTALDYTKTRDHELVFKCVRAQVDGILQTFCWNCPLKRIRLVKLKPSVRQIDQFFFFKEDICTLLLAMRMVSSLGQVARQGGMLVNWLRERQISRSWPSSPTASGSTLRRLLLSSRYYISHRKGYEIDD